MLNSSLLRMYQANPSLVDAEYFAQVCYLPNLTVERMLVLMLGLWLFAECFSLFWHHFEFFWPKKVSAGAAWLDQFLQNVAQNVGVLASFVAVCVLYLHEPETFFVRNRSLLVLGGAFLAFLAVQIVLVAVLFWQRKRKPPTVSSGEVVP